MVGLVTDSAASLGRSLVEQWRIAVAPLSIEVDGRAVTDSSMTSEEIVGVVQRGLEVHTSAPSPGAFLEAIEQADDGEGVVVVTVGHGFSSTYESASLAATMSGRSVEVVDSETAAGAEGLVVLAAAAAAHGGMSLEAVAKMANDVKGRVRLVAQVGDLTQLVRSGRIPSPLGAVGNAVGVRPVFEVRKGAIRPLRPVFSVSAARHLILSTWRRTVRPGHRLHLAGLHVGEPDEAQALLDAVSAEIEPVTCFAGRFGPAMVVHTGPDLWGLAWWWEPSAD